LDGLDRRILRTVQRDCSLSADQIGERCGTTGSTALRRLNRMRRDGTISGEVAVVDAHRVGRGLMLFVTVRLEREDGPSVKRFIDRIMAHPNVLQFYFVTGTTDYVIMLSVRRMEDYDHFLRNYLVPDPLVVMSDTNVVIKPLKMSLAVPIDEPSADATT
jgi:DNA-binding Lrp family transcriptional regulator